MAITPTITDCLDEIKKQRKALASNITAKGVSALASEKLNSLVIKVLDITTSQNLSYGEFRSTTDTPTVTLNGIGFVPYKIGLTCYQVLNWVNESTEISTEYVGMISALTPFSKATLYKRAVDAGGNDSNLSIESNSTGIVITVTQDSSTGKYSVTLSYEAYNSDSSHELKRYFKANYDYSWTIVGEEFLNL